jgi:hypothetical protein
LNRGVRGMTRWVLVLLPALVAGARAEAPRKPLPLEVARSAAAAVDAVGRELSQGRIAVTLEKMYEPWKDRAARRLGGMDKLVKVVADRRDRMQANGMQLVSMESRPPTSGFEVTPAMKIVPVGDNDENFIEVVDHYQNWLVFVPTTVRYRVIEGDTGRTRLIESDSFQVAVARQGTNDWTFIDGAKLTVDELRTLFPTLPPTRAQLGIPEVSAWREVGKQ